ncbi:MAG: arsenate reductase ArsC [Calditrichaeota bacterium]|nr:arsenate reductase ArsC [Calditrichota bacterium]
MKERKGKTLIICTGNSCRSQMAEAIINQDFRDSWIAYSAGTNPSKLNPLAIQVMSEIGIDISQQQSKSVDEFRNRDDIDLVITVCDNAVETCPLFSVNTKLIHINIEDPAQFTDQPSEIALTMFRKTRDQIREKLHLILENQDSKEPSEE